MPGSTRHPSRGHHRAFPLLMHRDPELVPPAGIPAGAMDRSGGPEKVPASIPFRFDGARCWAKHLVVPLAERLLGVALENQPTMSSTHQEKHVPLRSLLSVHSVRFKAEAAMSQRRDLPPRGVQWPPIIDLEPRRSGRPPLATSHGTAWRHMTPDGAAWRHPVSCGAISRSQKAHEHAWRHHDAGRPLRLSPVQSGHPQARSHKVPPGLAYGAIVVPS
jgi:hypothetical protein